MSAASDREPVRHTRTGEYVDGSTIVRNGRFRPFNVKTSDPCHFLAVDLNQDRIGIDGRFQITAFDRIQKLLGCYGHGAFDVRTNEVTRLIGWGQTVHIGHTSRRVTEQYRPAESGRQGFYWLAKQPKQTVSWHENGINYAKQAEHDTHIDPTNRPDALDQP